MENKDWMTVSDAARFLGISRSTLYRWSKAGKLPIYRVGIRVARVKRSDVEKLFKEAKPLYQEDE